MKRTIAVLLAIFLMVGAVCATPASAATVVAKGIDVSYWQGPNINWSAVASHSHGDFAILRAYCYGKDSYFDTNYARAKQAGVPVGVYCFIYGRNATEIQNEVNGLLSVIRGKQFEYPIYIDVEDSATYASVGRQATTDLVKIACQMLEAEGFFAGVYTYTNFANNYIYMNQLTAYTTWIAEYNDTCNYTGVYAMWQYGCKGSVGGISPVDVNYSYMDFPTIIKKAGLNGFPKQSDPDDTSNPQKTVVAKGIDVSKWQMPLDWTKVASDPNIDYAIIRVSWSGLETTEWATFYAEAKAAKIPIGCYAYTMAATVEEAKAEARKTVELLKGKQFEYPIYIDAEEPDVYNAMDKATLTAIIKAECDVLKEAGYMAGVYTNTNYATNKIDMSQLSEYTTWIADYRGYVGYTGEYDMWQYSDDGMISATTSSVDLNYCYTDFPTAIKKAGLNGYEVPAPSVPDESSQPESSLPDPSQPEDPVQLGDVNEDEKIDAKDALEVLKFAVGKTLLTEKQQKAAEVIGDEDINAKDALEILKYSVQKINKFPIEG